MSDGAATLAVDLGGTQMRAAVVDHDGELVLRHAEPTPRDAECPQALAAAGEAYFGAGQDHADLVYLTVSTGIGAGVLLDRRLVASCRSLAEVGHTLMDLAAAGRREPASFEDLGSGTALERYGPRNLPQPIEVLVAGLGDDAGLVGAAAWRRARAGPCRG